MKKQVLKEIIQKIIKEELTENQQNSLANRLQRIFNNYKIPVEQHKELMNEIFAALELTGWSNIHENQPATVPSKPKIHPGKPTEKPKPRRPLGNPNVQPKPKAHLEEDNILNKIVDRFKSKKINESKETDWQKGYKTGYNEGFKDGKNNKPNKFIK